MKTIAIVCGGYSKEATISLRSAEQIIQVIDKTIFKPYTIFIDKDKWVVKINNSNIIVDKADFSFALEHHKITFDAVFMAIHGTPGEDGKLQSYFELLNIPVTTCNAFVSALTFNKYACKLFLKEQGVLTAKSIMLRRNQTYNGQTIIDKLGLPLFVKPNNGGSSFGVTKVKKITDLDKAIEMAFAEDTEIIIEEFIDGREFTCGVFFTNNQQIVLPVTEIVSKNEFFDYQAKYEGLSEEITPARLSDEQTGQCQLLTREIYNILGCSGVVRVDYLYSNNRFYFMEVNTVPGMSRESIIPQQAKVYGYNITDFYTMLINDAIERGQ